MALAAVGFVAVLAVVFLVWDVAFAFFVITGDAVLASDATSFVFLALSIIAFSGLEGFRGDAGRDKYGAGCCCLLGEVIRGDW